ncbi:hypothetical protein TEA_009684 [Camellia sinensis var. sinensis]|uniref:Protein kinase domain-containing protein n=1 Tax=Camellia sinensis var. sinensis TaxID=542762 RepID=A0A4S4EII4_CAMSN|nr:hypothetical protein TEA_009684 [Camellia sinensis var. sinensis]
MSPVPLPPPSDHLSSLPYPLSTTQRILHTFATPSLPPRLFSLHRASPAAPIPFALTPLASTNPSYLYMSGCRLSQARVWVAWVVLRWRKGGCDWCKIPSIEALIPCGKKYQIKGCAGQGGFAQVFKAYVDRNPDEVVALKVTGSSILSGHLIQRSSFGFAHRLHLYSDYSIIVCDYLGHGTLQDAINSNVVIGGSMEEVLCIYYTTEMLSMLETLHSAGIIHGDFKPDNLLIRYARDDLTEDGFYDRTGPWLDQGLCLVDWGRGIDLSLFPDEIKFYGDCRTSGFRCVEMQEKKPWSFQVDIYGLCVIVHMMLHNSYMEVEKKASPDGGYIYKPKSYFKRYWQVQLWNNLFTKLLNINPNDDYKTLLKGLRESFQDYMSSNPQLIKKLKQSLAKQRTSLCSA